MRMIMVGRDASFAPHVETDWILEWKFAFSYCSMGRQHLWWAAWGFNVGTAIWGAIIAILQAAEMLVEFERRRRIFMIKKNV